MFPGERSAVGPPAVPVEWSRLWLLVVGKGLVQLPNNTLGFRDCRGMNESARVEEHAWGGVFGGKVRIV